MFLFISFKLEKLLKALIIIVSLAIIAVLVLSLSRDDAKTVSAYNETERILVIDPGHGGIDGGAISDDGIRESDINLAIALKMRAIADFAGIKTVLTRETDTDNSEGDYSERENLLARAELANSYDGAVLISIHQNKYPSPQPRGAETMYAADELSRRLGLIAQDDLVAAVDNANRRVAVPAPEKLLLTSSVDCPAILVECGFMSNPEELRLLASAEYQQKIALALVCSYIQFTGERNETENSFLLQ